VLKPLCLSVCLALALPARAGIDQLTMPALKSPRSAQALLLSVTLAGDRLVAVGERGIVITSDDRGATWTQADVPLSSTLTAVHFASATRGWAVGHDGVILHSADGGRSWSRQLDGNRSNALLLAAATEREKAARSRNDAAALKLAEQALDDARAAGKFGPSRPLLAVWFRNETEGFALGAYGMLLHTRNGGAEWELWSEKVDNPDGLHLNAITATPAGTLLIAGEAGRVYRSSDGGASWETLATGYKGQLYGALGVRNDAGGEDVIAFGFKGNLFRLAAGSKRWDSVASGTTKTLSGGVLLPNGEPLLISADGRLISGSQRGRTYQPGATVALPAVAISPAPKNDGCAVSGIGGVKLISADALQGATRP
jgi:photosystem II stability/assembly factor-like uncharacterized protein